MWDYFYRKLVSFICSQCSKLRLNWSHLRLKIWFYDLNLNELTNSPNDTSFQMFVGLLCNNLKMSLKVGSMQEWKQMKGRLECMPHFIVVLFRVYSKFHQRRIQELREAGLHNFCVLFISLALTADIEDVGNKMCGFCEMVELGPQASGRKLMAWRGMFAIAMEYVHRKMDITSIAEKLVTDFNKICSCMLNLEDVRSIFLAGDMDLPTDSDTRAFFHFLKAIQAAHTKIQGWKERIELRDKVMQYFCDMPRLISPVIQSLQPSDVLSNMYAVVGYIVKCCAPLIFIESKPDCPLPSLINSMVVPHTLLNTEKAVSPVFLNVVREHLHQFVIGLSKLDYRKAPYLQRRLGDIVYIYLPKFWVSLRESFSSKPTEAAVNFREFIVEIVRDKFLMGAPLFLPAHHHMALMFLKELVKRSTKKDAIATCRDCRVILYGVMKVHMLTETVSVQNVCHYLIQQYTESVLQCGNQADRLVWEYSRDAITESLAKFVRDYKKTHLDNVIKTLERIPVSCREFVQSVSKQVQHHIVEHESYRGVGADSKLRTSYIRLVRHFGFESADRG
ncbi:hypothetical protein FSP39_017910 [Pinctada imbricata]|uniref:Protein MMS22-like n=1 Tax=Pinctada imbricata TaxID=66713 RepID=A0AA89BW31_PINIB|nr:hypothetical protein FSP39_017910 [Pinctada imbricata]